MDSMWFWPLALLAFLLAWPALRAVGLRVFGSKLRVHAIYSQPDHISLERVENARWRNETSRESTERQLAQAGFVESGTYTVREMPDLMLALYAHPAERAYAILYDHPRSDFWVEFVTRYEDGSLATYTTLEPMQIDLPPDSVHVSAPELTPAQVWQKMRAERPRKPMHPCARAQAAQDFERGYAEAIAYHKKQHAPDTGHDADDEELKQAA